MSGARRRGAVAASRRRADDGGYRVAGNAHVSAVAVAGAVLRARSAVDSGDVLGEHASAGAAGGGGSQTRAVSGTAHASDVATPLPGSARSATGSGSAVARADRTAAVTRHLSASTGASAAALGTVDVPAVEPPTITDEYETGATGTPVSAPYTTVIGGFVYQASTYDALTRRYVQTTSSGTNFIVHTTDVPSDDHYVQARLLDSSGSSTGLALRCDWNGLNGYLARLNGTSLAVFRVTNDSYAQIGDAQTVSRAAASDNYAGDLLRFEAEGRTLRVLWNGVTVLTHTDVDLYAPGRHVGLRAVGSGMGYDSLEAAPLGDTQPPPPPDPDDPWASLNGINYVAYGDSTGVVKSYTTALFVDMIAADAQVATVANRHIGSDTAQDMALRMNGSSRPWSIGQGGLVTVVVGGNDIGRFHDSDVGKRGYVNSLEAALCILRADTRYEDGNVVTGTWTVITGAAFASAGRYSTCNSPGTSVSIDFTGSDLTFLLLGSTDQTSGSPFEVLVDGHPYGTGTTVAQGIPSINKPYPWVPVPFTVRGLDPSVTHRATLRHTGTQGQVLAVDSALRWGRNPPRVTLFPPPILLSSGYAAYPSPYATEEDSLEFKALFRDVLARFPADGSVVAADDSGWDPGTMTGGDGLHPDTEGHRYLADVHLAAAVYDPAAGEPSVLSRTASDGAPPPEDVATRVLVPVDGTDPEPSVLSRTAAGSAPATGSVSAAVVSAPTGGVAHTYTFDGPDQTGVDPGLTVVAGGYNRVSNGAQSTGSGNNIAVATAHPMATADQYAEVTIDAFVAASGVILRSDAAGQNGYLVRVHSTGAYVEAYYLQGGVATRFPDGLVQMQATLGDTFRAEVEGDRIRCVVNGNVIFDLQDSRITSGAHAGLYANSAGNRYGYLSFGDLNPPPDPSGSSGLVTSRVRSRV